MSPFLSTPSIIRGVGFTTVDVVSYVFPESTKQRKDIHPKIIKIKGEKKKNQRLLPNKKKNTR